MHPGEADRLNHEVIGAAIEVHRVMGAGLLEKIYERCLMRELTIRGISARRQERVEINYKGDIFTEELQFEEYRN